MKSEHEIEMDFSRAKSQAQELNNIANDMRNLANNSFEGSLQQLSNNWKGDNATRFIGKGRGLKSDIVGSANNLDQVASTIRTIAQNIYNAEMEALRIAREREYQERLAREREEAERNA